MRERKREKCVGGEERVVHATAAESSGVCKLCRVTADSRSVGVVQQEEKKEREKAEKVQVDLPSSRARNRRCEESTNDRTSTRTMTSPDGGGDTGVGRGSGATGLLERLGEETELDDRRWRWRMLRLRIRRLSSCAHESESVVDHDGVEEGKRGEGVNRGQAGGDKVWRERFKRGMEAVEKS